MTRVTYHVKIIGYLWSSTKTAYDQTLTEEPTAANIRRYFPDCQDVVDFEVTKITTVTEGGWAKSMVTTEREMLRDWQNEDSEWIYSKAGAA